MTRSLIDLDPWPVEPAATASIETRMTWYAAVARWAPSKHNSQPWRFVVRKDCLEVWADPLRRLPETDPSQRELTIACGAALHLVCVAARAHGYLPRVSVLPEGSGALLARVTEASPRVATRADRMMLELVPRRRTDRGPLDSTPLPATLPFLLQSAAAGEGATLRLVTTPGQRHDLAALVLLADRALAQDAAAERELGGWLRDPGDSRSDGVPTDHSRGAAASYRAEFVQRDFSRPTTQAPDPVGEDRAIIAVLCTPGDAVSDWLTAGRALASLLLIATAGGASASYLNQPIEQPNRRSALERDLGLPGVSQLILRIGAGTDVSPPPRRPVDDVVVRL